MICQLCSRPFRDPRLLSCLHSFCYQCLQKEIEKVGIHTHFACTTCQRSVPVPVGGVSVFPQNLHLAFEVEVAGYVSKMLTSREVSCDFCANGCTNPAVVFCCSCRKFLCKTGHDCHRYVPQLLDHSMVQLDKEFASLLPTIIKPTEHYCSQPNHKQQVLDFYCKTCNCLICRHCIVTVHKDHSITELSLVAESHRDEMKVSLQLAQEVKSALAGAIDANKKMMQQIETSKQIAESTILQLFRDLIAAMEERKKSLLSDLEMISLSKITSLSLQKEQFEKMQQDICQYTEATSHILQTHTDNEVVTLGELLPMELKATLKKVEKVSLTPNDRSYLTVSEQMDPDLLNKLLKLGDIVELSPAPHESKFTFDKVARVNTVYHIQVETMTSTGRHYPCGGLVMKAELRHRSQDGSSVLGEVEDHGDGTYTISITPQTAGPHQLIITMDDKHLQNSPCDLKVKGDYTTLCDVQQVISVNGKPLCVAVHEIGDIYVGSNNDRIYVYDHSGHLKNTIGSKGQLNCPFDIFIKKDMVYVADMWNHCIQKLTTRGELISKFGKKGSGQGEFNGPGGVLVDSKDRVIVSDSGNNRVQVLDPSGKWILTIDGSGGDHRFKSPRGLALDSQGNIYVAAFGSNTIKVFTPDGAYIKMYGGLNSPRGLAIDEDGYSLVSEGQGNRLSVFDPQGKKIHTVENLITPTGIALDCEHFSVYVSSLDSGNVSKYTYAS